MALRFRRDVQKSSYYVWFLGAEEAKGFRGSKVITSALPYLIERSTSQELLKLTLQVSHKGMKIIQGPSKHFIPHSAITCSIRIGDIAACVLLLYNSETKCPLHVHAYRCDSETTAEALHQQLEVLINRSENQKQFQELEKRMGITRIISPQILSQNICHQSNTKVSSPKKTESSIGSTSTRDSECSESFAAPPSTTSHSRPQKQNPNLFHSLAAELRTKLNGNGPPLLLPPRDYDTVHRSKGNIFRNGNEKLSKNQKFSPSTLEVFSQQIRSFENLKLQSSNDPACYIDQNDETEMILKGKTYITNSSDNRFDIQPKLNLTDKQKHLQICNKYEAHGNNQQQFNDNQNKKNGLREYYVPLNFTKNRSRIPIQNEYYLQKCEKNPYRQSERDHLYYNYRIEDNIKPLIRQNSFENDIQFKHRTSTDFLKNNPSYFNEFRENNNTSTDIDLSVKNRFHGAKEKFRLIERSVSADINNRSSNNIDNFIQRPVKLEHINVNNNIHEGRPYENKFGKQSNVIKNAKSLSNLSKGYRHSYAEISPAEIPRANKDFKFTTGHQFW